MAAIVDLFTTIRGVWLAGADGLMLGTASNPLVTSNAAGGSGLTQAEFVASTQGQAFTEAGTLSITTGGTAQDALALNASRKSCIFSNTSDTAMYVRFGATAAVGVGIYCAPAGGGFALDGVACPTGRMSVFCATTGKTFYAGYT